MKDDVIDGWWEVPAAEYWTCPECKERSKVEDWQEVETYCEDCGSHDGRECPNCGKVFDHVWDSERLSKAQGD